MYKSSQEILKGKDIFNFEATYDGLFFLHI